MVASLAVPNNLPVKPPKTSIMPPPSKEAETARRENLSRFITLAVLQFSIVIFLTAIAGPGVGFFIGALLMAGFIVTLNNSGKNSKVDLEVKLESARREWNQLETEWTGADVLPQFNSDAALIRQKIDEHHRLQQESRERVKQLHGSVFQYKLDSYLASFKISDAKIAGVTAKQINLLKGYNLRTAADVDGKRLGSLPPAHNEIKEKILEWRKSLERGFVYDPNTEIPEAEQKRLSEGFTEKRGKIEREIENLLVSLRSGSTLLRQRQQHLSAKAETLARQLLQSESDLAAAGGITAPVVVLILITTLIPMFGNAFSSSSKPYPLVAKNNTGNIKAVPVSQTSSEGRTDIYSAPAVTCNYKNFDTWTDVEIKNLADSQKKSCALDFLQSATQIANEDKDYRKAEKKLETALRLDGKNTKILNKMGDVLYEQKRYKESLEYLNRSLSIDAANTDTKFSIGINYLRMNYFEDARRIFSDIVSKDQKSFEAQFNLGQAYKGLKQYYSAVSAFRTATEIKPNDSDAIYNYAVCLDKIGSREDVLEQYEKLLEINPKTAEMLRKDLGLKKLPPKETTVEVRGKGRGEGYGVGDGYTLSP